MYMAEVEEMTLLAAWWELELEAVQSPPAMSLAKLMAVMLMTELVADGAGDFLGGLAGWNSGTITASYASGNVDGGDKWKSDAVGGLVGHNRGIITASYATSNVSGGDINDNVGGLVGNNLMAQSGSAMPAGSADGGGGPFDNVGGLVGSNSGMIIASYATIGRVDGGDGWRDRVGGLVGYNWTTAQSLPAMPPAELMAVMDTMTMSAAWWGVT